MTARTATTDLSTPDPTTTEATTVGTAIISLLTPVPTIIETTTITIKTTTQAATSDSKIKETIGSLASHEATAPTKKTDVTTRIARAAEILAPIATSLINQCRSAQRNVNAEGTRTYASTAASLDIEPTTAGQGRKLIFLSRNVESKPKPRPTMFIRLQLSYRLYN